MVTFHYSCPECSSCLGEADCHPVSVGLLTAWLSAFLTGGNLITINDDIILVQFCINLYLTLQQMFQSFSPVTHELKVIRNSFPCSVGFNRERQGERTSFVGICCFIQTSQKDYGSIWVGKLLKTYLFTSASFLSDQARSSGESRAGEFASINNSIYFTANLHHVFLFSPAAMLRQTSATL